MRLTYAGLTALWGKERFVVVLRLLVVLLAAIGLSGCMGDGSPGEIYFSPDESVVAYTYVKRIDLPLPPEMPTMHSTVYLQWCRSDNLKDCRSIKIDSYGKSFGSFVQDRFLLAFSPDSKKVAVRSPRYLEIIDLETMDRLRLTDADEHVGNMGWLGNTEVVFSSYRESSAGEHSRGIAHRIFRQSVTDTPGKRLLLYEKKEYNGPYKDYISPNGEYVIFLSRGYSNSILLLLNTRSGEVKHLTESEAQYQGVSWKPDSRCAFCLTGKEAFLWYTKESRKKDLSDAYNDSFRRYLEYEPSIYDRWTPDGRYIIINSLKTGGCLVCPDPWHVVPIGKRLVAHVEQTGEVRPYRDTSEQSPYINPQPFPGWVNASIQVTTGEKSGLPGRPVDIMHRNYFVDDSAEHFLQIPFGGYGVLSPNGKRIVFFNDSIYLDEKPVSLPD
jgi:hypothetical protein